MNWSSFLGGVFGGCFCFGVALFFAWVVPLLDEFRRMQERERIETATRSRLPPLPPFQPRDPNAPLPPRPITPDEQAGIDAAIAEAERKEREQADPRPPADKS